MTDHRVITTQKKLEVRCKIAVLMQVLSRTYFLDDKNNQSGLFCQVVSQNCMQCFTYAARALWWSWTGGYPSESTLGSVKVEIKTSLLEVLFFFGYVQNFYYLAFCVQLFW